MDFNANEQNTEVARQGVEQFEEGLGLPKEKVEGFKLSKDQLEWMKVFKGVNQVERALAEKLKIRFGELQQLQQMHDEAAGKKIELLKMAPVKGSKELPGQERR